MTWQYVEGDKYSKQQLIDFKTFFYQDYLSALFDYNKYERYSKYGLPNFRTDQLRRKMGIEEAERNLNIVNQAIEDYNANNI